MEKTGLSLLLFVCYAQRQRLGQGTMTRIERRWMKENVPVPDEKEKKTKKDHPLGLDD